MPLYLDYSLHVALYRNRIAASLGFESYEACRKYAPHVEF